ncbi:FAD-binding oxidoreductase [Roseovarius aestuarii]|nr:FAD-binding oxidoreductase [Roseovarius aestuarii]
MVNWTPDATPGTPYWWEGLALSAPDDPLPAHVDLLIIGAGFTGLSGAIAAAGCGATVAIVDADDPGKGASTRNGGMFGAHPRLPWGTLKTRFGTDVADALFAEAQPAFDFVHDLIESNKIDCDFQHTGRIQLAWSASHFEGQKRLSEVVRAKSTVRTEIIERADLSRHITTEQYFGGLFFPGHGAIQPAKLHQGLLQTAAAKGVSITGHARVTQLERSGATFVAHTPKGTIRADKVLLATNGYTTAPFKWQTQRIFPLPSYIIATEHLPEDLIARLAPGQRMMVETRARHSYFRLSPDHSRILFGGRAAMVHIDLETAAARQHATMCEVWPELRDTRLSHAWVGNTGYSFTHMPHVGVDRGLHYSLGYSGSGTVMAPYLGAKAAYQAMGDARGDTAYSATTLARHWLHPGTRPHFLQAANLWYKTVVDWVDYRNGR